MANFVFSLSITDPSHLVIAQDYAESFRVSLETPRFLYALNFQNVLCFDASKNHLTPYSQ